MAGLLVFGVTGPPRDRNGIGRPRDRNGRGTHCLCLECRISRSFCRSSTTRGFGTFIDSIVSVSSHESATFQGGGGHFRGKVARLATGQGLVYGRLRSKDLGARRCCEDDNRNPGLTCE